MRHSGVGRRSLAGPLAKSLVFVLVTVLATTALALGIANSGVSDTVGYAALFSDSTGLNPGDTVRIAGVQVGQVDSIAVVDRRTARVRFSVRRGVALPASATASIKYLNLVGQRYVDVERGTGPVGQDLSPGAVIPLTRTTPALDLTQLFNGFQPLFQGLSPNDVNALAGEIVQVLQGEDGTVQSLLQHLGTLTTTLAGKDQVIGEVIHNLSSVVDTVNTHEAGFTDLVTSLQQLVSGFDADRQPLGQAISAMADLTTTTSSLLTEGRAPLKSDIAQLGRLSTNLSDNTPQLQSFLRNTPAKMQDVARLSSYGSWLNLYLCQVKLSGVTTSDGTPPPTGIGITQARCGS